jgi:hypothetical protein
LLPSELEEIKFQGKLFKNVFTWKKRTIIIREAEKPQRKGCVEFHEQINSRVEKLFEVNKRKRF